MKVSSCAFIPRIIRILNAGILPWEKNFRSSEQTNYSILNSPLVAFASICIVILYTSGLRIECVILILKQHSRNWRLSNGLNIQ